MKEDISNTTLPDLDDFLKNLDNDAQNQEQPSQNQNQTPTSSKVIGIIDLGSNSVRLLLVQVFNSGAYTILNRVKHMVRLGENAFADNMLQEPAMERTLYVLRSFMEMCEQYEVAEIYPMATAAVRDANNAPEFLRRVLAHTGIEMKVISGQEEARLICLGVSSGIPSSLAMRTYIDIGGGSTEVAVANAHGHECLDSLKVGCVRLTNQFLQDYPDKVPAHVFSSMCSFVRSKSSHATGRVKFLAPSELIGSSGTALTLQNLGHRLEFGSAPSSDQNTLSIEALRNACRHICKISAEERRALPGVSTKRADVLVAGAAILLTLMEEFGFTRISVSSRNLQDGILMDYIQRRRNENAQSKKGTHTIIEHSMQERSVREQSVFQLAQRCRYEEQHSKHMAKITLQLHDSAVDLGIIPLDHQARELLYYAAILHDIGIFIAYTKHPSHGSYIIQKTEMLGFTDEEIDFMAMLVQMHSLKPNKKSFTLIPKTRSLRNNLQFFPLFLSLAENMDRLHCQNVQEALFVRKDKHLKLIVQAKNISPVEIEAVSNMDPIMLLALGEKVEISFTTQML